MNRVLTHLAEEDLETVKGLLYFRPDGGMDLHVEYHHHTEWRQVQERLLEVLTLDGGVLYRNERLGSRSIGGPPFPGEGERAYSERSAKLSDGTAVVLVSGKYDLQGKRVLIRVAYSEDLIWGRLKETLAILLLALPLALTAIAFLGYKMAARALDPIEKMARQARHINSENLDERLPVENPDDELGHLAAEFNATLARLGRSFEQLRRFTSDASHELRTPLAAIRSIGEVGLQHDTGADQYRDTIGSMLEEVNRLTGLVDNLLTLSRADAGHITLQASVFPLMPLLEEAASLLDVLIEDKTLKVDLVEEEPVCALADRLYIRQAVLNIFHNAVKFTPAGGTISARVFREASWAVLAIADTGPGIPAEHAGRVFERFYRVDEARSGEKGAGLGLSIAQWAVRANKGEIGLVSPPGGGCTFWVRLPSEQSEPVHNSASRQSRLTIS
jgi:heavy metal sensor kinase